MFTSFKKVGTDDLILAKFQDNVDDILSQVIQKRILDGNLLEGIVLTTSASLVSHLLQRPLAGYIVVKRNANATVYDQESSNILQTQFVKLIASATVTVSLWVF